MTWTIDPRKFGDDVRAAHRTLVQKTAIAVDQQLVQKSPVDTGRFRGNWQAGVGSAPTGELPVRPAEAAIAEAVQVARSAPDFPVVFLANNLPYAQRLNEGHSQQAPAGFVEASIDSVVGLINRGEL